MKNITLAKLTVIEEGEEENQFQEARAKRLRM
jgi:hypothetical protein